MSSSPHFVVLSGPEKGTIFSIRPGKHFLGRQADAVYKLSDPRASRLHCEVSRDGETIAVRDNNSSAGTLVNGTKVTTQTLHHGDAVQIGDTLLRYQERAADEPSTVTDGPRPAEQDARATEQLAELSGRTLSHFEIGELLGKGTSSMVFRAQDTEDGKTVALKVMRPSFSQGAEEMQRFVRAMKTMMPLQHANLVRLYGAGKSGPYCWASMELVEGDSLTEMIKRIGIAGMLDWRHAFRAAVQIGRALAYAHGEGIIHRNITPANIMVASATKQAKLGDLMLAKALEGTLAKQVTRPGEIVGDINYMPPERTQGAEVDGRGDLFSLGATVYALLTGKPPFAGSTFVETLTKLRGAEPAKPSTFQMGIPSAFEGVVLRMLAKRPLDRFQTAGEVVQELERIGRFNGVQA
jgi:serine/threonine protein kinase